jgi:hypothetical protein
MYLYSAVDQRIIVWQRNTAGFPNPELTIQPYFPDVCPRQAPAGWPADLPYDAPHTTTVCPACLDIWRTRHFVSDPVVVPAGTPLTLSFPWTRETTGRPHTSPTAGTPTG